MQPLKVTPVRPPFGLLAGIVVLAYLAPLLGTWPQGISRVATGLVLGSAAALSGLRGSSSAHGLWRLSAILVGAFGAAVAAGFALEGERRQAWAIALIVGGFRPVVEVFAQGRRRPRLDSVDVHYAAGGTWVCIAGTVSAIVAQHWLGLCTGVITGLLGAALVLYGLVAERGRLAWLRGVAAGQDADWTIQHGGANANQHRLLDVLDAGEDAPDDVYSDELVYRGNGVFSSYRGKVHSGVVVGALADIRRTKPRGEEIVGWTLVIMFCTMIPLLLLTACLSVASYANIFVLFIVGIVGLIGVGVSLVKAVSE